MAKVRTVGLSPKVTVPTSLIVGAGVIVAVLDAVGVLDVDDSVWVALLAAGGVGGGTGFAASPGKVQVTHAEHEHRDLHEAV